MERAWLSEIGISKFKKFHLQIIEHVAIVSILGIVKWNKKKRNCKKGEIPINVQMAIPFFFS